MNSRNKLDTDKRESNNVTPAQKKNSLTSHKDSKFNLNDVTTVQMGTSGEEDNKNKNKTKNYDLYNVRLKKPCNNNKASESNNVTTAKTENNPDKTEEME